MKKVKLFLLVSVLVLVTAACRFSFNIPEIDLFNDRTATPVAEAPQPVEPVVTLIPATEEPAPVVVSSDLLARDVLLSDLYQRVVPGVVSIVVDTPDGGSLGSGFVFDKQGHVVTNFHVVDGATDVEVDFSSGVKARGEVIGTDLDSDLAVIKVDVPEEYLFPLPVGNSDELLVGQTVVAIGNPFGLSGTMTIGIVSAKGRTLDSMREADAGSFFSAGDIIQTDAAINPGNSGGPLLNLNGEVIGVNRAIRTSSATAMGEPVNSGIGFAISVNIIKRVAPELIASGRYDYPYLGISSRDQLTLAEMEALSLPRTVGAYVISVTPGSPADKAGIQGGTIPSSDAGLPLGGDLIIEIDDRPVITFGDLLGYLMANKSPGDQVVLTILRDNEEKEVTITLGKRP